MTNQIQGEIIFQGITGSDYIYTPWMPVHGTRGTFALEILEIVTDFDVVWNGETRTRESSAATPLLTSDVTDNSTGVHTFFANTDMEELVRYRVTTGSATVDVGKWAVIRFLEPSWQLDGQ